MKSPRTIRLAALHLTGLWLLNPGVIKYYMTELKILTLYGSGELGAIVFTFCMVGFLMMVIQMLYRFLMGVFFLF